MSIRKYFMVTVSCREIWNMESVITNDIVYLGFVIQRDASSYKGAKGLERSSVPLAGIKM